MNSNLLWASLVAQSVKNLPAMRETWIRSLGCEDPLEEGMTTHSSIFAWRIPKDRGACSPWGCKVLDTTELLSKQSASVDNRDFVARLKGQNKVNSSL